MRQRFDGRERGRKSQLAILAPKTRAAAHGMGSRFYAAVSKSTPHLNPEANAVCVACPGNNHGRKVQNRRYCAN
jgi:hypothetical protein